MTVAAMTDTTRTAFVLLPAIFARSSTTKGALKDCVRIYTCTDDFIVEKMNGKERSTRSRQI